MSPDRRPAVCPEQEVMRQIECLPHRARLDTSISVAAHTLFPLEAELGHPSLYGKRPDGYHSHESVAMVFDAVNNYFPCKGDNSVVTNTDHTTRVLHGFLGDMNATLPGDLASLAGEMYDAAVKNPRLLVPAAAVKAHQKRDLCAEAAESLQEHSAGEFTQQVLYNASRWAEQLRGVSGIPITYCLEPRAIRNYSLRDTWVPDELRALSDWVYGDAHYEARDGFEFWKALLKIRPIRLATGAMLSTVIRPNSYQVRRNGDVAVSFIIDPHRSQALARTLQEA